MATLHQDGRFVVKAPTALRLHPAMEELGIEVLIPEISQDSLEETVLITQTGLIVAGFRRWRLAVLQKVPGVDCLEYDLADADVLPFVLALQQQQRGWNAFIRIRLALKLEPGIQERALANMRTGGKQKGLAILPKAGQIDVRQEIAEIAGVGGRNVSKVKQILSHSHPRIIEELLAGSLSINQAQLLSNLSSAKQVEQLTNKYFDRALQQIEKRLLARDQGKTVLNANPILEAVRQHELRCPGAVSIRIGRRKETVVILGEDLQGLIVEGVSSQQS